MKDLSRLLLLLFLMSGMVFIGCGDDDNGAGPSGAGSDLIGTWTQTGMTVNGATEDYDPTTVTFKDDGTGSVVEYGQTFDFEWSVSDSKLTVTEDGESNTTDYSVSGNTLTITYQWDGATIVETYTKQ